jgi:hypothetical protein
MTNAENLARELATAVIDQNDCECDEAKGDYCIVDLAQQLLVELGKEDNNEPR